MARTFRTPQQFRHWLERNHASQAELVLRCFKVHARHRGIGHKEALDEALCFGWIDGVVRSLDVDSFTVRFTPRRPKSKWSVVNIRHATRLEAEGRMHPAGLKAFRARAAIAVAPYSFETSPVVLAPELEKRFRANTRAWTSWESRAPSYKRTSTFWIMQAKRPETRLRRLQYIIGRCERGESIGVLETKKKKR
jgi:uncharacterized protein YdeI (YjbR/CyaY-like superfamily)